jgi:hypothetical protein
MMKGGIERFGVGFGFVHDLSFAEGDVSAFGVEFGVVKDPPQQNMDVEKVSHIAGVPLLVEVQRKRLRVVSQ